MIVVRLSGGLGNQLFQYAMGKNLAHVHDTELKLDISGLGVNDWDYALDRFRISEVFATQEECQALTTPNYSRLTSTIHGLFHNKPKRAKSHIKVKAPHFEARYKRLPDNVLLEGYWQSEQYFSEVSGTLRKEFTLKTQPTGTNVELAELIGACNSVSVHIRRGDYVSNSRANQTHGTTDLSYYSRAIQFVCEKVTDASFFVFSDDPDWSRENLRLDKPPTFVSHNPPEAPHEDLRLMSMCQHNIIANSTFSWWAAWLNANPSKIVCAPSEWYVSRKRRTDGLIPDGWLQM